MKSAFQEIKTKSGKSKEIASIYLTNHVSATLIIPIEMARRQGLDQPSKVTIEESNDGILIRKLDF
jgi:hypothetical protein